MIKIKVRDIVHEDFTNYYIPSMFIALGECNWKCCIEQNLDISMCQNSKIAQQKEIELDIDYIFNKYCSNKITSAIVIGGLEPFTRFSDLCILIKHFRENNIEDDFVIYTGYYPNELEKEIEMLKEFKNIVIKFGRYIPKREKVFDNILGINLASDNQYATKIS